MDQKTVRKLLDRDLAAPAYSPRKPRVRVRAAEGIMTIKAQDTEFRHPETTAHLQSLTNKEAKTHPPIARESGGVAMHYWRAGSEVRRREVGADAASIGWASELEALHAAAKSEFGRLLPRLKACQ